MIAQDMKRVEARASVASSGMKTVNNYRWTICSRQTWLPHIETAYYIMFAICAGAYLIAWFIMHLLVPPMKPIPVKSIV